MDTKTIRKSLVSVIFLALAAVLISLLIPKDNLVANPLAVPQESKKMHGEQMNVPVGVTIEGEVVCLPHRNAGDFVTMECAYGLKADNGFYYGLNSVELNNPAEQYQVGERVRVNGLLVTKNQLSTHQWQVYNIIGIISVESFQKI